VSDAQQCKDFAVGSSGISKVHQLCVIITETEEGNNSKGSKKGRHASRQSERSQQKGKRESPCLGW
jgi:hypothetical protein